jgi:hypothetical protein
MATVRARVGQDFRAGFQIRAGGGVTSDWTSGGGSTGADLKLIR